MADFLKLIPDWAYGISLLLVIVGLFVLIRWKGFTFKTKNIEIKNNSENIYLIIHKSLQINEEISDIKYHRRLDEQMSYCEDIAENIRKTLLQNFLSALIEKNVPNSMTCSEYKIYEKSVFIMLDATKSICRRRFKEMVNIFYKEENVNHTYDFIKNEFEEYKKRSVQFIVQRSSEIITSEWIDNKYITREENYNRSQKMIEHIAEDVEDVFQHAIEVQLKFDNEIKKLDNEMKEFISKLSGE